MSKYIDNEELRKEIIVSFGKGDLTPNAKLILIQMINSIFRRLMPIEQMNYYYTKDVVVSGTLSCRSISLSVSQITPDESGLIWSPRS